MRRRTELFLAAVLIGLLVVGFLMYQGRLDSLDMPRRGPVVIPNPAPG